MVTEGERLWWFTESGAVMGAYLVKALRGTSCPARRVHVDLAQEQRILPEFGRHLHDHVILIQRRIHGRDLAFAEGIVKGVVNQLRRNAEARRGGPIILHEGLEAVVLLIGVHVRDRGGWSSAPGACGGRSFADP